MSEPMMEVGLPAKVKRYGFYQCEHPDLQYRNVVLASDYDALLVLHKASPERERELQAKLEEKCAFIENGNKGLKFLGKQVKKLREQLVSARDLATKSAQLQSEFTKSESQLRELREVVKLFVIDHIANKGCAEYEHEGRVIENRCHICIRAEKAEGK